jgi:hypothetical protein
VEAIVSELANQERESREAIMSDPAIISAGGLVQPAAFMQFA